MIEIKREIILEEGVPVSVYERDTKLVEETMALIGKATRQFASEISLESHRQGQFLPEVGIRNGLIIKNKVVDEDYIVVANYPEVIDQQLCTTIARMIVCNSKMTIGRLVEDADHRGKIIREFKEIYSNLSIYAEPLESEVRQMDPGKAPKSRYKIYAPSISLDIEDQIQIDVGGVMMPFKLTGYDYLTFKGLTLLEVVTETRR
jgi:hypothetical protein